jgi:ribonuclease R
MFVEGLVHITELGGDFFRFDEARQELRGERTGIRYSIGARVRVQVSRVDLDGRKIDFRWVPEAGMESVEKSSKPASVGKSKSHKSGQKPDEQIGPKKTFSSNKFDGASLTAELKKSNGANSRKKRKSSR